jgi:hypothetical protein
MSESSAPPPGSRPPRAAPRRELQFDLAAGGGLKKLLGGRGRSRIVLTPEEIVVEHGESLRGPLRFAPGAVTLASVDPGRASAGKGPAMGRFPILHRLGPSQIVPRDLGIMGWLWTSTDGSAFPVLGSDAPNTALLFSPPLTGLVVEEAFEPAVLEDLAKRAPLGEPALFGLLLRADQPDKLREALERYGLLRELTDRDVPPVQRRHLPDDKQANPSVAIGETSRADTSIPPPPRS